MIGEAGRTGADVSNGGQEEGRLIRIGELPLFLVHPARGRAHLEADLAVEGVHGLVLHFPAGVGAIDDLDDASGVALVGVIVDGQRVAEDIEGDFLRIAQAVVDNLEAGAVGLEAEDEAAVAVIQLATVLCQGAEAAIAEGAIQPAVGPEREAVEVVTRERDAHAEAVLSGEAGGGTAVGTAVAQHPDMRDAGEVDGVVPGENPGCGAVKDVIKAVGEDTGAAECTIRRTLIETSHNFGALSELGDRPAVVPLAMEGESVGGGSGGEVVQVPEEIITVVLDALAEAWGLGDKEGTVVTKGDGSGRGDAVTLASGDDAQVGALGDSSGGLARDSGELGGLRQFAVAVAWKGWAGSGAEDEVVCGDDAPAIGPGVENPKGGALAAELCDIPVNLFEL